jgi:hypothetical protein
LGSVGLTKAQMVTSPAVRNGSVSALVRLAFGGVPQSSLQKHRPSYPSVGLRGTSPKGLQNSALVLVRS